MPFKTNEARDAFLQWASLWSGNPQESHPNDISRFNEFALVFFKNEDIRLLNREEFVQYAKQFIKTSATHNKGLVQRAYERLVVINDFLRDTSGKQLITFKK